MAHALIRLLDDGWRRLAFLDMITVVAIVAGVWHKARGHRIDEILSNDRRQFDDRRHGCCGGGQRAWRERELGAAAAVVVVVVADVTASTVGTGDTRRGFATQPIGALNVRLLIQRELHLRHLLAAVVGLVGAVHWLGKVEVRKGVGVPRRVRHRGAVVHGRDRWFGGAGHRQRVRRWWRLPCVLGP